MIGYHNKIPYRSCIKLREKIEIDLEYINAKSK